WRAPRLQPALSGLTCGRWTGTKGARRYRATDSFHVFLHFLQRFLEVIGDDEKALTASRFWNACHRRSRPGRTSRSDNRHVETRDGPIVLGDRHTLSRGETMDQFRERVLRFLKRNRRHPRFSESSMVVIDMLPDNRAPFIHNLGITQCLRGG